MRIKRIPWADGTPSDDFELTPETDDDVAYIRLLERLRLMPVGDDFIRAARARSLEDRLASVLPHTSERQPLSLLEGLVMVRLPADPPSGS